jgi:hypothetical protein
MKFTITSEGLTISLSLSGSPRGSRRSNLTPILERPSKYSLFTGWSGGILLPVTVTSCAPPRIDATE